MTLYSTRRDNPAIKTKEQKMSTELAVMQPNELQPYANTLAGIAATMENFREQGEIPNVFDLPRARVPGGGGRRWIVTDGETEDEQETLEGFILGTAVSRSFWPQSIEDGGGSTPPECFSRDGRNGIGDPGGSCMTCPHNQFPTKQQLDAGARPGKRCKENRIVLLATADQNWPLPVILPAMSIKPLTSFVNRILIGRGNVPVGTPLYAVKTRMTLVQDSNRDGIKYSKAAFEADGIAAGDALTALEALFRQFKGFNEAMDPTVDPRATAGSVAE